MNTGEDQEQELAETFYRFQQSLGQAAFYNEQKKTDYFSEPKKFVPGFSSLYATENYKTSHNSQGIRAVYTTTKNSISISFSGSIDAKSAFLDFDPESPGVKQIKRAKKELIAKLSKLIAETENNDITINIAGFSLGGCLAQAFTNSLLESIATNSLALNDKKITTINLYTRNSPKTSIKTNNEACKYAESFKGTINAYHQYNPHDLVSKAGEALLFATKNSPNQDQGVNCRIAKYGEEKGSLISRHKTTAKVSKDLKIQPKKFRRKETPRGELRRAAFYGLYKILVPAAKAIRKPYVNAKRLARGDHNILQQWNRVRKNVSLTDRAFKKQDNEPKNKHSLPRKPKT